jgi:hypothetical protein
MKQVNYTRLAKGLLLPLAESVLRPADLLDNMIRRLVIPLPAEDSRSEARISPSPSILQRQRPLRIDGILSELQAAIGQRLRAEYDLARPTPARLIELLRQLEQRAVSPNRLPQKTGHQTT